MKRTKYSIWCNKLKGSRLFVSSSTKNVCWCATAEVLVNWNQEATETNVLNTLLFTCGKEINMYWLFNFVYPWPCWGRGEGVCICMYSPTSIFISCSRSQLHSPGKVEKNLFKACQCCPLWDRDRIIISMSSKLGVKWKGMHS